MSTSAIIADVRQLLAGEPVFMAGSLVAADTYGFGDYHDVDLFCPTGEVLISAGRHLLANDYKLDPRFERVWYRWLKMGFNKWHTNSLRLHSPSGVETNLVFKLTDGHPTTSLAQVLESFDFGLLGMGYDLELNVFRDMRSFLFPGMDPAGPLPMMPNKRANWRNGFISQYNGLREAGRYAKYHGYGYDLTLVKDDLSTGYWSAAAYFSTHFKEELRIMAEIYERIAEYIDDDDIAGLAKASREIEYTDSLDKIMEALE